MVMMVANEPEMQGYPVKISPCLASRSFASVYSLRADVSGLSAIYPRYTNTSAQHFGPERQGYLVNNLLSRNTPVFTEAL
jgi:hypothetical protein